MQMIEMSSITQITKSKPKPIMVNKKFNIRLKVASIIKRVFWVG
jgi:hypothetical protein